MQEFRERIDGLSDNKESNIILLPRDNATFEELLNAFPAIDGRPWNNDTSNAWLEANPGPRNYRVATAS